MNNTLTGLGLALVLALATALIGPWFVNWSAYRDDIAAQAGVLLGAPVRLAGTIDARLLPSPYLRFRGLSAGDGQTRVAVDEVEIDLAFAPLLRGEVRAERLKLVRPRVGVAIDAAGAVRTAFSSPRGGSKAAGASFEKADIVDGTIVVSAPDGPIVVERLSGLAESGALAGPYRFEGAAGPERGRTSVRLSTGSADAAGAVRFKIAATRDGRPETFEADGALTLGARPFIDARFVLERPAARRGEVQGDGPWRVASEVKGDAARLRFENLDLAYGADDRALRLGGRGEATLGARRWFDLEIDARQVDLDRFLGEPRSRVPAAVLAAALGRVPSEARPPFDGRLRIALKSLVLGGDVVRDVAADVETAAEGWRVASASAVLPGGSPTAASGALALAGGELGFAGKVDFATADLPNLRRWLSGGDAGGTAPVRRVAVKGEVSARHGAVSIGNAEVAVDGARSTGRLAWRAAGPRDRGRLDAALVSERLDLDALGADRVIVGALSDTTTDVGLTLQAKALTFAGVRMADVSIEGSLGAEGIDLKRFSIRDAGGATLSGSGRIAAGARGREGEVGFRVEAERLAPVLALARAVGAPPEALDALDARAGALAPVKLGMVVEADAKGRRFTASGDAAGGRLDARLSIPDLSAEAPADLDVRVVSADGRRLAALAGFEVSPLVTTKGGEIALRLSGALARGMTGEGRFAALGLDLGARGTVALAPVTGLSAQGKVVLKADDLTVFAEAIGRLTPGAAPPAPAALAAKVAISAEGARIDELMGEVAGGPLRGRLTVPADPAAAIEGDITVDDFSAAAFAALALSPDALSPAQDRRSIWPSAPFGPAPLRGVLARLDVTAAKVSLGAGRTAADARFVLALRRNAAAIERFGGALDGGRLTGSMSVARSGDDATVSLALRIDRARAERLLGLPREASPLIGDVDATLEAQGTGRTLAAIVGSLTGAGVVTLADGAIRRLDVAAIDRVEPQVEAGLALEAPRIAEAIARDLGAANLKLSRAVVPFTLSGGVLRSGAILAETPIARLGGGAAFDLRRPSLKAALTLQPNRPDAPQIGVTFDGPVAAPKRGVDATALTGWLSVRAVERETRRIDAMEADTRERARIARQRADDERKRVEEEREKRRVEDERRRAEAERRRGDAEARALVDALPRPTPQDELSLPPALDLSPEGAGTLPSRTIQAPTGVFGQTPSLQQQRPTDRRRVSPFETLPAPQVIQPPTMGPAGR